MGVCGVPRRSRREDRGGEGGARRRGPPVATGNISAVPPGAEQALDPRPGDKGGVKQSPTAPLPDRQHRAPGGKGGVWKPGTGGDTHTPSRLPPTGRTGTGMLRGGAKTNNSKTHTHPTLSRPALLKSRISALISGIFIRWWVFFIYFFIYIFFNF